MIGKTNSISKSGADIGAMINVTTTESTLNGKNCLLKLNNVTVATAVFSNGGCSFPRITIYGNYVVEASDGTNTATTTVTVTAQNILDKDSLNATIQFTYPLPTANVGDTLTIAGLDCMCIGTNRYVYMSNIGGGSTWDNAVSSAQNWAVPTNLTNMYNVSNKALMTLNEANALSSAQRTTLVNAVGNDMWLGTSYSSTTAYFISINEGQIKNDGDKSSGNRVAPAFTIAMK